jgi:hypothetical protein
MEVNRQFQDLHSLEASADWVLKQQVERDICLLYHQLSNYSYIMGDLYYGSVFAFPYWEYLDLPGLDPDDGEFIRNGCLVMILAMAWEHIDHSTGRIHRDIPAIREAVEGLECTDEDTGKLIRAVRLALDVAERDDTETPELVELSDWVHKRYVRGYFRHIVQEFDNNPYFQK